MKRLSTRKLVVAILVFIILLGAGTAAFLTLRSPISFAYYEPAYLPPNVAITEKRISITDDGKNRHESADLRLETTGWTYSIKQTKADGAASIGNADQNFDDQSDHPTCSIFDTQEGTEFRLCHWVDDWSRSHQGGKVSVYEVKFIKDGTYLRSHIPTDLDKPISVDDIREFIDSFEQKSTNGVPVQRSKYWV